MSQLSIECLYVMVHKKENMKQLKLLIIFLIISTSIYGQKIQYRITTGINYNYVLNKHIYQKISTKSPIFFGTLEGNSKTVSNLINNVNYTFERKTGSFINGSVIFPLSRHFSFKTGLGISMNNIIVKKTSELSGEVYHILNDTTHITYDIDELSEKSFYGDDYGTTKYIDVSCQTFFLTIPLHLRLGLFINKVYLTAGVTLFNTIISNHEYSSSDVINTISIDNNYINDNFINFHIGVEYKLYKNIFIGYHFEPNMNNSFNHSREDYSHINLDLQLNNMAFNISYKF